MSVAVKLTKPTEKDLVPGFNHIVIRPGYMGGKPAVKEKRIAISQILEALAGGASAQDLMDAYELSAEVVAEALAFAAAVVDEKCPGLPS